MLLSDFIPTRNQSGYISLKSGPSVHGFMLLETLFQSLNPPGTFCFNVIAGERCISLGWTVSTEISMEGTYGVVAGPRLIHGCYAR